MEPTRKARLESYILEELSQLIRGVKDHRVPSMLSINRVELTIDGKQATIFVLPLGGNGDQYNPKEYLAGLESASGYIRRQLGKGMQTKHIPTLIFKEDKGIENSMRVNELLREVGPIPPKEPEPDKGSDEKP